MMAYKLMWLILMVAVSLECQKIESVAATKGQTILEQRNVIERVFLKRQKRFLIFEKGATAIFQGNIAKAIIAGMPRGLNEITEYTLSYELPWQTKIHKVVPSKSPTEMKSLPFKYSTYDATNLWNYNNGPTAMFVEPQWKPHKKLWCPKEHIFRQYYNIDARNSLPTCLEYKLKRKKRQYSRVSTPHQESSNGSTLLFDLITHLANMHGYNARHCIMRTLCESRHLLFPPGRLLFHDLLRILLSYAQPATQRHAPFRAAIQRENLQECMKLYGLHCRWSFLQHFTESIVTAANSMAISPTRMKSIQLTKFM